MLAKPIIFKHYNFDINKNKKEENNNHKITNKLFF